MKKWSVLVLLSMASFIMVIDSTAMNVSISNLVADLNTELSTIQMIMSVYTLVMAVFMLPGAKIADIFGKKRVFKWGVLLYGAGTLTAALSVNWVMLFAGWALIEGIASAMMMPTALSLITSAYEGKSRTVAMSIYTAIASVALAIGPIFGGLITTYLSWRFVFGLEALIVIAIVLSFKTIDEIDCKGSDNAVRFDFGGTLLLALGLVSLILGTLMSKQYGWFIAKEPVEIFAITINTGVSVTALLLISAVIFLACFAMWLKSVKKNGKPALIDTDVFKSRTFVFVMLTNLLIQLSLISTMFVVSIYLQNAMRYDALHTGLTLLPLSVMLFIAALCAVKAAGRFAVNRVVAFGTLCIIGGALYMYITFSAENAISGVSGVQMIPAMALLGMGLGCSLSLTSNIGLSSLPAVHANQASGAITTVNNLGSSLGTSVMGSLLISGIFASMAKTLVDNNMPFLEVLGEDTVSDVSRALEQGVRNMQGSEGEGLASLNLTAVQMDSARRVLLNGLNESITQIFLIVAAIAAAAFIIALLLLKPGHSGNTDVTEKAGA